MRKPWIMGPYTSFGVFPKYEGWPHGFGGDGWQMTGLNNNDIAKLIDWCNLNGYTIREHNHPKTRSSWDKWQKVNARRNNG